MLKRIHLICDFFLISNICDKYGMGLWFGLVVIPIILVDNYNQLCSTTNYFFYSSCCFSYIELAYS